MDLSADSESAPRRRSTREIKVKKLDDDYIDTSSLQRGTPKKVTSKESLHSKNAADSSSPASTNQHSPSAQSSIGGRAPSESPLASPAISNASISNMTISNQSQANKRLSTNNANVKKKPKLDEQRFAGKTTTQSVRSSAMESHARWSAEDDVALVTAVLQSNDLRKVYMGVKFSCHFTLDEISERWFALLYDPTISKLAIDAMRSLPSASQKQAQEMTLFSKKEEVLISSVPPSQNNEGSIDGSYSTQVPDLKEFEKLLQDNSDVFHEARTPQCLRIHWQRMFEYRLLPFQRPINSQAQMLIDPSFAEIEESLDVEPDPTIVDPIIESEMILAERKLMRDMRISEAELAMWPVLTECNTSATLEPTGTSLAMLRGRVVRYLIQSKLTTIGRGNKSHAVDVDLSLEGPAFKVSRRHAQLELNNSGEFLLINFGRLPIYVNGEPLLTNERMRIEHNALIEISNIQLMFLINPSLQAKYRAESYGNMFALQSTSQAQISTSQPIQQRSMPQSGQQSVNLYSTQQNHQNMAI